MNGNESTPSVETTFVGEDENEADPVGLEDGDAEPATMLLVGSNDVTSGAADPAFRALAEEVLAPVEVVVVPGEQNQLEQGR